MRGAVSWIAVLWLSANCLSAGPESGVVAEIFPEQVRPGDLIELRVEMDRGDYAQFELQVPAHDKLHRVAVESVPVRHDGDRYRQRESWLLQADSSGEIVIDGATVTLETGQGSVTVKLPPLQVEVLPYARQDEDPQPVGFPAAEGTGTDRWAPRWWWIAPVLALGLGFVFWSTRSKSPAPEAGDRHASPLEAVLEELEAGRVDSPALGRLMEAQAADWPPELREAVAEAVYSERLEVGRLAALLREEVLR